jgi:RND superfamily putative drug exporter
VVLVLAGLPFLGVRFGLPDDRALAPNAPSHVAMAAIENDLGHDSTDLIVAVTTSAPVSLTEVANYEQRLSLLKDAKTVQGPAGVWKDGKKVSPPTPVLEAQFDLWGGSYVSVTPTVLGYTPRGEALAKAVRAVPSPYPVSLVGGNGASLIDTEHVIGANLPLAGGIMVAVTLIVLFLFTGSVILPVKAIVMTLLSLSATFGLMVWGFQQGHLAGVLDFQTIGYLDTSVPILMFCVVFGLSMDYEVFLLSRIKEEYDRTGDNEHSVALGLEKTGRLVSSAALLLAVVFISFSSSGVQFIKLLGVGSCLAVIIDATIVRGILVPSFMRLAGDWNWWAPAPLKKVYNRIGLRESADEEIPEPVAQPRAPYPSMAPGPVVREGEHVWRRFDLAEELWMHPRRPTERPQPPVPAEADGVAVDLRDTPRPVVVLPAESDEDYWPVPTR